MTEPWGTYDTGDAVRSVEQCSPQGGSAMDDPRHDAIMQRMRRISWWLTWTGAVTAAVGVGLFVFSGWEWTGIVIAALGLFVVWLGTRLHP